ncbi:ABC-type sugar transport system ATPase subunit [Bradyrhizobium sp. LB13.1]
MPEGHQPILELQGITKSFGGVEALRGVDFALSPGEIHGLVGENGAGKSTLMKIIAGVHTEFSGRFLIDGQETHFRSARDAHSAGIAMVHQELSVAPDLTVAENVFLGNQPTNRLGLVQWRRMAREAGEQLARFGIDVDPMSRLGDLPIGLQQLIEIARVLFSGARIVILDEPTSALSPPEVERLFATLRRLRAERHGNRLHLAFHRGHLARVRHGDRVPQRAKGRGDGKRCDQQGRADRGHDRPRR